MPYKCIANKLYILYIYIQENWSLVNYNTKKITLAEMKLQGKEEKEKNCLAFM